MKRFLSLVMVLCMLLPAISFSSAAAVTKDFTKKGRINTVLTFTEADFSNASSDIDTAIEHITVVTLPSVGDGVLNLGADAVLAGQDIAVADIDTLWFNPVHNFNDTASFTWTVTDASGESPPSTAHMDFSVERPDAENRTVKLIVNTKAEGEFTASDPQDLPLTYAIVTGPAHGDITFSVSRGTFTYTPDRDFTGTDTVTFTANNGFKTSLPAIVTFIVADVKAPAADDMSVDVEMGHSVSDVLAATDINEPPLDLTYSIVTTPAKGTITHFDRDTGSFTYHHNTDKLVRDSFTFRVSNGYLYSNTATVTVDINTPTPLAYRDMKTHWALKSAGTLAVLDLTIGEQIQDMYYYHPGRTLTRAEYALFLNSIMGIPLSSNTATSLFADVTEPYMVASLNAAYEHGISVGTTVDGRAYFHPNKAVTRIEAMKMLDNAMKFAHQSNQSLTFHDRHLVPDWAEQAVRNLVGYRIVSGSGGYLRPLDLMTRAEAAQMLFLAYLERKS